MAHWPHLFDDSLFRFRRFLHILARPETAVPAFKMTATFHCTR